MAKSILPTIFLLCAAPMGWAQQVTVQTNGNYLPAGTLLGCTLDEPNFNSQTARPGDPVLCRTTSVEMFGRQVIPRGAYLSARLREYRDPGHFAGKGWIQLEFTSLTLPCGTFPMNAKVISAGRYRVDGDGRIKGKGHATRDAVEWAIPILWPIKVLTLPARGPRPGFKGETRIELRLMEDMLLPESATAGFGPLAPRTSQYQPKVNRSNQATLASLPPQPPAQPQLIVRDAKQTRPVTAQGRLTLLVLRGGRTYLVADYWVENGNLDYITAGGALFVLPLEVLDTATTKRLNQERGIAFQLVARVTR